MRHVGIELRRRGTDWPTDCSEVTAAHLALVRSLWLARANITALKEDDFSGLVSLESLVMNENPLTELPEGIFEGSEQAGRPELVCNKTP